MFTNFGEQTLFFCDALELRRNTIIENHVNQARSWVADAQNVGKFATRLVKLNQLARFTSGTLRLSGINHVAQFFGQFAVTKLGFMRCNLHCNREKVAIITVDM